MKLTTHSHLMLRLRMCGAIPPHQYAFMACTGPTLPFSFDMLKVVVQWLTRKKLQIRFRVSYKATYVLITCVDF